MDDIMPIIILIIMSVCVFIIFALGVNTRENAIIEEMEKYGNVRINGKAYVLEEVVTDDK